jgi:2-polyprenyl-3-methyl-5-hydroxy-6-metoxy-1,4-benzoquinol methylase
MALDLLFCPVCERETKSSCLGKYRGKSELFNNNELFQCFECEIIFVYPLPSPSELDQYYKTAWLKDKEIMSVSKEMEMIYQIQGDARCNYLVKHQILPKDSKVLDIGSGYGYMFKSLRNKGFKEMRFFATDPSPICLKKLREIGVNACDSLSEVMEKNFDLVTLGQVLEHIPNPISFLQTVMTLVKSGGHIYIDVPDRDDTHKALLEPHTLFYSEKSILNLAKKLNLKVIHITSFGVKREKFIQPNFLFHRIVCKINSLSRALLRRDSEAELLEKKLFDIYQFDREGDGGWWLKTLLKVEK